MPESKVEQRSSVGGQQGRSSRLVRRMGVLVLFALVIGVSLVLAGRQTDTSHPAARVAESVSPRPAAPADNLQPSSQGGQSQASPQTHAPTTDTRPTKTTLSDERLRKLIVGKWEQERYGKRTLTVNEDGTACMVVQPDCWWSCLFGDRLTFDIQWSIDGGRLTFKTSGGQPKDKVELVLKTYGRESCQPILDLTEKRMLVLDDDEETQKVWKRIAAGTP